MHLSKLVVAAKWSQRPLKLDLNIWSSTCSPSSLISISISIAWFNIFSPPTWCGLTCLLIVHEHYRWILVLGQQFHCFSHHHHHNQCHLHLRQILKQIYKPSKKKRQQLQLMILWENFSSTYTQGRSLILYCLLFWTLKTMSALSVKELEYSEKCLCMIGCFNFLFVCVILGFCVNFALVCAYVYILHNQFFWSIEMIKHDIVEKVVDDDNDYMWIMVE